MSNLPTPKSREEILEEMFATYMAKIAVNDLYVGSAITSLFETFAQAIYRSTGDTFAILREYSVDRATGDALQRLAAEERLTPFSAKPATGKVTITDTSFQKISSKIYAGGTPPNVGSLTIDISNGEDFPASGAVYLGRGTPNIEGPLSYSSITQVGSYWTINLDTPTTRYHNLSESVIVSQGGTRNIPAGTVVKTIGSGASPDINFSLTKAAIILDGEVEVTSVPVAAQEPGSQGNIPSQAIKQFSSAPFTGATVTNPNVFTTGRDSETDEDLRIRIKKARISKGLGTKEAIKAAVLGAQADGENATVTSNEIVSLDDTTLFIDNGEGYEETYDGVGLEYIVDSALGGETHFQLETGGSQTSVKKAFLESTEEAPFAINPGDRLALLVGGILSEHIFNEGDFRSNGSATTFEIVSSVNANSDLSFSARTIDNGTRLTFFAKEEVDEYIQKTDPTTGTDSGLAMGLPTDEEETLRLYKNKTPLSRNGRSAVIESENQTNWSNVISDGETLIVSVDGTSSITYTINDSDFLSEGNFTTVSKNNSLDSWINVLNSKITGVTASVNGNRIVLTSNLGTSSRAALLIDESSTLVSKGMFTASRGLSSQGKESDFSFSRNTAQFKLTVPLDEGDSLTSGTEFTRAEIANQPILGGNVSFVNDAELWFLIDNPLAYKINHGVTSDSLMTVSKQPNNTLRFKTSVNNAFGQVQSGDYLVLWSAELSATNRVEGRVFSVGSETNSNDYFEVVVTPNEYAAAVAESVTFLEGVSFMRSDMAPQKVDIPAGSYNINVVANLIEESLGGVEVSTENEQYLNIRTLTYSSEGSVLLMTFNDAAKNLNFTEGQSAQSITSHTAFQESGNGSDSFPLFVHSSINSDESYDPPTALLPSFTSLLDLASGGVDENSLVCFLNPYLVNSTYVEDAQPAKECVQIDSLSGTLVDIDENKVIRRLRVGDRFYVASTYDFGHNDFLTVVLDDDATNKTFPIKMYRRAITNTTMPVNSDEFRAYDVESGATTEFEEFFGGDFSFKNYKAFMQAKNVIDPSGSIDEDAILYRASEWGVSGEKINVGYIYPDSPNLEVFHKITLLEDIQIRIGLKSGDLVANNIDGTTEWDVTVTPSTPTVGTDEVTFTWNGTGSNPSMVTLLAGHFVNISNTGEFSEGNQGVYRISSATSTSFTVRMPTGQAIAENNVGTLESGTITLYENNDTTAQEISDYVNQNLSNWITSEVIDDNGTSGSGIVIYSTYENNDFSELSSYVQLLDGENFIEVSELTNSAPSRQFKFKSTLSLPSFDTNTLESYKFSDGEEVRFVPTTAKQVEEFCKILAVTGITTLGGVDISSRENKVQFTTQTFGSLGSVKVSGGTANESLANVIGTSSLISDLGYTKLSIDTALSGGFHGGQWVKLAASNVQKKTTGISFTTNVTITPNQPEATTSIVELGNKDISDRYFGQPRSSVRTRGCAFHVEKHGSLVCFSWDGVTGSDPLFSKTVEFSDDGGQISVNYNSDSLSTEYIVTSGTRNFSEVSIGDTVVFQNFSDSANNGQFVVNGISEDGKTLSVLNQNGVSATSAVAAIGDIVVTTEIKEGDTVDIREPFSALNQGLFKVIRRFDNSFYIENDVAVEERVFLSDNLRSLGFDSTTVFNVTVDGDMKIEWSGAGTQPTLSEVKLGDYITVGNAFNVNNRGTFMVTGSGDNYVTCANAKASAESGILVSGTGSDILECHNPAMVFSEYDATVAGDRLVISGNVLGSSNKGEFVVKEVLSRKSVVVDDILSSVAGVQLNDLSVQVYIDEQTPYVGYKKIYNKFVDLSSDLRTCLVLEGTSQYTKINEASGMTVSSVNKLSFSSVIKKGIDGYKYHSHSGLISKSNKIVYGDPRDSVSFPGVAAAGAEIFIEPPLVKRIEVSINVRVKTGIPFSKITEQVRNNIAALINSSPIGESIAISDIISTVNAIPGTVAISITSPAYSPTNDVLVVNPSEKPFILDIVNDISVSKVE